VWICNDIRFGEGSWFEENLRKAVGDGVDTYFWSDPWFRGIPLKECLRRMFLLSVNQ